ncbi:C40 family peptidase [Athalassotoga saccharophila]|uniref:C40 family peptidase n=1 Tax=Athalassotoga saccharophila TaxID=1441386 RepID=UPI00137A2F9E|nr:C40 family peptidase [Athalassotoga saccharophila]BBJ28802.1 dipeptidyl-peptidase 6 [Athalassotoga saccharophila]
MKENEFFEKVNSLLDKRLCAYGFKIIHEGQFRVIGFIDTKDSMNLLIQNFKDIIFDLTILDETIPFQIRYGVVNIPVIDMRRDPRFRSERIHQLIFGEIVKILRFENEYILVKDIRTNYTGYIKGSQIDLISFDQIEKMKNEFEEGVVSERFARVKCGNDEFFVPFGSRIPGHKIGNKWKGMIGDKRVECQFTDVKVQRSFKDIEEKWILFLGTPYLWGGASSYGYDCSGYVGRLYDYAGIKIPRDADLQQRFSLEIEEKDLRFGDLIFFPGHVGMYVDGRMVHANLTQGGVGISHITDPSNDYEEDLRKSILKFGRIHSTNIKEFDF